MLCPPAAQGTADLLCWKGTLLAYIQLGIHQDPRSFLAHWITKMFLTSLWTDLMWSHPYCLSRTWLLRADRRSWGHDWECPCLAVCCRKNLGLPIFKGHQKIAWEQTGSNLIEISFLCNCAEEFVIDTSIYRQLWSCLPSSWFNSGVLTGIHTVSAHIWLNQGSFAVWENWRKEFVPVGRKQKKLVRKTKQNVYDKDDSKENITKKSKWIGWRVFT